MYILYRCLKNKANHIGPITRPCIDTFLCSLGTSMEHLSIDREDECTSRLQENVTHEEALELEA